MSKKYLLFAVLVGFLTATAVSAQTSIYAQLRESLNRIQRQLSAVGGVSVSQTELSNLQTLINNLRTKISSLTPSTPATPGPTPEPVPPAPPAGSCPGGATMPSGTNGQTIRCDGTTGRWVANSSLNIGDDSDLVNVEIIGRPGRAALRVVGGEVNYFEKNVGIGVPVPQERLDLGGGNIKMGYERVSNTLYNVPAVGVGCPNGKKVISAGCAYDNGGQPVALSSFYPITDSWWQCTWMSPVSLAVAHAICANIR